ncbi:unnamed protein product [Blepharisma stoltei]|uniref:CS domain-containing protein n=1 Tax=Blepharisma stoltei TaxID=1481888 RepID=A0AAU9J1H7_9CILI|nr:unnamed protein product [Blepharisma stoltei]
MEARHTPIKWAQRKAQVFITLELNNLIENSCTIQTTPEGGIHFKGTNKDTGSEVTVDLELFEKIVPAECKWKVTGRSVQLSLAKENKEVEYWPRLLKQTGKLPWIAIDWSKWVDEEDENSKAKPDFDYDYNNMPDYDEGEDSDEESEEEEAPADLGDLDGEKGDIPTGAMPAEEAGEEKKTE